MPGRGVAADLHLVDHILRAGQRLRAVTGHGHHGSRAGLRDDLADQPPGKVEPFGADVMQRKLELARELGVSAQIGDDVAGELDAAGADERNLRHARKCSIKRSFLQDRAIF